MAKFKRLCYINDLNLIVNFFKVATSQYIEVCPLYSALSPTGVRVWVRGDQQVLGFFEMLLKNTICVLIYKIKLIPYILLILSNKI
jgi:hypothetical protein